MPGIVWDQLDAITMSRLGVELIKEELARRELDITGSKEELIQRLTADITARREASPCVPPLDPATLQNLSVLLQHLPRQPTAVTTLPDLSASIPHFEGSSKQDVKVWLEDVRRIQQLAAWEDATTRLIAASKLKGPARNWHLAFGSQ